MMNTGSTLTLALLSSVLGTIALILPTFAASDLSSNSSNSKSVARSTHSAIVAEANPALSSGAATSGATETAPAVKKSPVPSSRLQPSTVKPTELAPIANPTLPAQSTVQNSTAQNSTAQTIPVPPADQLPLAPGEIRIVSPQAPVTGERFTNLVVQYAPGTKVQVLVNQQPIAATIVSQTQTNPPNLVTQVWYSIPLQPGENRLTVQPEGGTATTVTLTVKELKARLEFLPSSNPRIPADGRSAITLEGQILDDDGAVIAQDGLVTLSASAGKFVGADQDNDRPGFQALVRDGKFTAQLQAGLNAQKVRIRAAVDLSQARPVQQAEVPLLRDQINDNGRSRLDPPTQSLPSPNSSLPAPQLQAVAKEIEAYTQVEFITNLRSPIVSGVLTLRLGGGGNDFYGSFRDFLNPDKIDQDFRVDVGAAVFGTGRVGDWLVTAAFNNQRPLNEVCDGTTRLFRDPQFCDQVYPVYGDSSTTEYLTPSIDSVYFKIERTSPIAGAGSDYAMWGDYSTPEFAAPSQLFTATARQLHGFKGNYNLGNLQVTGAYGNNLQAFQRDTIAPNGTSGYYFLSNRIVVGGSEVVYLETQELNRPGTVVSRKQMSRGLDYEIDYDRGAILFRRPIQQIEFDLFGQSLRRQIVVTYEHGEQGAGDGKLYAGRLQYNFSRQAGQESWAGITYLQEDEGDRKFELYGVDALIPLGKRGKLIAEFAQSDNDSVFRGNIRGNAYRFELSGEPFRGAIARAYYRTVDEDFANNATFSFTPGQTRYGAALAARISSTTSLQFQVDHEANFGIAAAVQTQTFTIADIFNPQPEAVPGSRVDNELTTIRAGLTQKLGAVELSTDWVNRNREDRIEPNRLTEDSNQLVTRVTVPLSSSLTFRAQNELTFGSTDPLYPDRTTLAIDWAALPGLTFRLGQQFINGGSIGNRSITSLDTIVDQKLAEDTTMTGRYSILNGINGVTLQGAIGFNHRLKLAPGLRVNLGYERIFGDIFTYTAAGQQFAQSVAVGQSSASIGVTEGDSYTVGLEYTDNPNFKASGRFEYRTSDAGDNMVISAGASGKLTSSLTALVRYQQASFANQILTDSGLADTVNIKVGLAYRNPTDDKFNALLRYEFRQNPSVIPDTILVGSGTGSTSHLMALEAIYAPNWRWEFYGKFAMRDTKTYAAKDLVGKNLITLTQLRATYRLGYRWDLSAEGRLISQTNTGFDEVGALVEAGYYLTPNLRLAGGYSFGEVNDRDFGDRRKGGFYAGLSLKLNDLFGGFGRQKIAPPQQREAEVRPIASNPATFPAWVMLRKPIATSPPNPFADSIPALQQAAAQPTQEAVK